jgi:uncharacterized protein (UPF0218 family)
MLRLPDALRSEFKEPFGPVYTEVSDLLDEAGGPLVAVGDVVTAHLLRAGRVPELSVIDGRTKRETVSEETAAALEDLPPGTSVENPAAELSESTLRALVEALDASGPQVLDVDGEEDLVTLPAVVAAPDGASVVYGQPDVGMVLIRVTPETRGTMRELLGRFEGDADAAFAILEGTANRVDDED